MNSRTGLALQFLIALASAAYSLHMASLLPAIVPTHWGINGKPDQFGSAATHLWLMPGVELGMLVLTLLLPVLSPKHYEVTRFARTFAYLMFLVTALMAVLHFVILNASTGTNLDIGRTITAILFAFFSLLGNVLGKVKQNFFVGVRTPWTLADGRVWDATHREAAHLWLIGGLIGVFLTLASVPVPILIGLFFVMALAPVVRSLMIYRKVVGRGK